MAVFSVTTSNWDQPSFWSAINTSGTGNTLDFSALPEGYIVAVDSFFGTIAVSDGSSTYFIKDTASGVSANVTLGGSSLFSHFDTMIGTSGRSGLLGGSGDEDYTGGVGDDILVGNEGNDTLTGGGGNDTLTGGSGADSIDAGDGSNRVLGGSGNDSITVGGPGLGGTLIEAGDIEQGTAGGDVFVWLSAGGNSSILLGDGVNTGGPNDGDGAGDTVGVGDLSDGGRLQLLQFDLGTDQILLPETPTSIVNTAASTTQSTFDVTYSNGNTQTFQIYHTGGSATTNDALFFAVGSVPPGDGSVVQGGDGDDTIIGGSGADTLSGGTSADSLDGGGEADLLLGDMPGVAFNATGDDGVGIAAGISGFPATQLTYEVTFASDTISGVPTLGSYATSGSDNAFTLRVVGNEVQVMVGGNQLDTGVSAVPLFDGNAHTVAVTWDSATGGLELYFDGGSVYTGTISTGASIAQGGTFVLGQEQDSVGGTFETWEAFHGTIYGASIYDSVRPISSDIPDSVLSPIADATDTTLVANWVADPGGASFTDLSDNGYAMSMSGDVASDWTSGADTLRGGDGADTLYGGGGDDQFWGGAGADYIDGGAGSNEFVLEDGFGADTIIGGDLFDTGNAIEASLLTSAVTIDFTTATGGTLTDGTDTVTFSNVGFFEGTSLNDTANFSGAGNSISYVSIGGNDTLTGSAFADNFYDYGSGGFDLDMGAGDDYVDAGNGADTLVGGSGADTIFADDGDDSVDGGIGDDVLEGWIGSDTLSGGAGADSIQGHHDADVFLIEDGFGADTIIGGELVSTGVDYDRIDTSALSAGITVLYTSGDSGTLASGGHTLGFSEIEWIDTTDFADDINFATLSTSFEYSGAGGNDTILAGSGNDTLFGGDGDDSIVGGDGADFLKTGQGQDTLEGGAGADTLMNAAGDDSLVGGAGDDLIVATQGQDTLEGGSGNDTLMGGTDGDSLDGGADNDLLLGDLAGVEFNATGTDGAGIASNITDFPTTAVTFELTLASTDTTGDTSLGSYAVTGQDNEFSLQLQAGTVAVYVGGAFTNTGIPAATILDGNVNTLAVSWDSATGALEVYVNGTNLYSGTTATGDTLDQGGTFVLGQDQDVVGGGFDTGQAFEGTIYGVRLYDDIRTPAEILDTVQGPVADTSDPNLVANWVADPNSASFTDQTGSHAMAMSGDVASGWSEGDDTLNGGTGDDTIYAGGGSDTILVEDGFGTDIIVGGEDADGLDVDVLDLSALSGPVTVTYTGDEAGTITDGGGNTITFSEIEHLILTGQNDSVDGSADSVGMMIDALDGDDTVTGGDGADSISGGLGNDVLGYAVGGDTLDGGVGDDTLLGGFVPGADDAVLRGGVGNDRIVTYGANDTVYGGADNDTIVADSGDELLDGGSGDDEIYANGGNDTITGGTGDDTIEGGGGDDVFTYAAGDGADTIADFNLGNSGALGDGDTTNNDFIDLSAFYTDLVELRADFDDNGVLDQSVGDFSDNTAMAGGDGLTFSGADRSSFRADNTGVVCFAAGTRIATPAGAVPVEHLRVGDVVVTRDNGPQVVQWVGNRHLRASELWARPDLKPVILPPKLLGVEEPLVVSPQHAVLLRHGGEERLVRAKHLVETGQAGARIAYGKQAVSYFHIMLERHEIIFANGAPTESFYPGPQALRTLSAGDLAALLRQFPGVARRDRVFPKARQVSRRRSLARDFGALAPAAERWARHAPS